MNIGQRVIARLEELAAQGSPGANPAQAPYVVAIPGEGPEPEVALAVTDHDRYSATLHYLEVAYPDLPAKMGPDYLRQSSDEVTRRLTYLEEPLALVELDSAEGQAQSRSRPPQGKGEAVIYWEVLLWQKPYPKARLARYRWRPGQAEREQLAYPATFATLGRLAQDLALSLTKELPVV